jgi:hypothetical protein
MVRKAVNNQVDIHAMGELTVRATSALTKNIPDPIIDPMTNMDASNTFNFLFAILFYLNYQINTIMYFIVKDVFLAIYEAKYGLFLSLKKM